MYLVRDDLTVSPLKVTSGICVIKELNVSLSDIKEVQLQVGLEEVSFKYMRTGRPTLRNDMSRRARTWNAHLVCSRLDGRQLGVQRVCGMSTACFYNVRLYYHAQHDSRR